MKKVYQKTALVIIIFVWITVVALFSIVYTLSRLNKIAEPYRKEIALNETVVFDEPEVVDQFGQVLTLNAGMRGTISDSIYYYGIQRTGYEYIETELYPDDGKNIPVLLTFDQGYEKAVLPSEDIVHSTHDEFVIIIDIGKIEDAETILAGYKESRERYYSSVRNTKISGAVVGISVIALGIVVIVLSYHKRQKIGSDISS